MQSFSHIVEYSEDEKTVTIYRLRSSGKRELYTRTNFPENPSDAEAFMRMLGENLLIDSSIARKILNL